jgi:RNA polymerase sigma-70 factor (ECF subfamily)
MTLPSRLQHSAADDDRTLATRVRAGDGAAFETLFRTHYASLCSVAFGYLRADDLAEDAVQNVFRSVWLHRSSWSPAGAVGPYLRTAVRNEALNTLRGIHRQRSALDRVERAELTREAASPARSIDEVIAAGELSNAIMDAAETLAPRCRAVFLLKWQRGLTYSEIADRLGISIKTVEMQMTRALKAVRPRVHKFKE